jgi:hypothetical protein
MYFCAGICLFNLTLSAKGNMHPVYNEMVNLFNDLPSIGQYLIYALSTLAMAILAEHTGSLIGEVLYGFIN